MGSYRFNNGQEYTEEVEFPSPLEGWVGSYRFNNGQEYTEEVEFPSPLEGWVGSYPHILYPKRETIHKIVPPWKLS